MGAVTKIISTTTLFQTTHKKIEVTKNIKTVNIKMNNALSNL